MDKIFVGYATTPEVRRETLAAASRKLAELGLYEVVPWERLKVGGRVIITQILTEIGASSLSIFDVSSLNPNVLFEIGFAIGGERRVWLLKDASDESADQSWRELRTLSTVGYCEYVNSDDIRAAFLRDDPANQSGNVFQDMIHKALLPADTPTLFYLPSGHNTDADRRLSREVFRHCEESGIALVVTDRDEAVSYTLPWYAQQVYTSIGVLAHFSADWRKGARSYNARTALVAGLAMGMQRPVFMLAEEDYASPIDYRDHLHNYTNTKSCVEKAEGWLEATLPGVGRSTPSVRGLRLETELRALGEPVAENEELRLSDYFVQTGSYLQVLEDRMTVFVGRRGTGKTANFFQAARHLRRDRRNVVCVIKPYGYEIEGLLRILNEFSDRELRSYLTEALWKYLLYSQVAVTLGNMFRNRPPATVAGTPAQDLLDYLDDDANSHLSEDFSVRLEEAVSLLTRPPGSAATARSTISESLHQATLRDLRRLIKRAAADKERIAVVIDNLDKAWDASADLSALSHLLLGLLVAAGAMRRDFARTEFETQPISLSLGIFLRTDIYTHVAAAAREPDKIPTTIVEWKNPDLLFRVIEERFVAGKEGRRAEDLWDRFLAKTVGGRATRDYVREHVLARPRHLVYFFNEAIFEAVNSGHSRITEDDVGRAIYTYSKYAFESLLVEQGDASTDLEAALVEFAGSPPVVTQEEAHRQIQAAGISDSGEVFDRLRLLGFLGIEVADGEFSFEEDPKAIRIDNAVSEKLESKLGRAARVSISPAYRQYLSVTS